MTEKNKLKDLPTNEQLTETLEALDEKIDNKTVDLTNYPTFDEVSEMIDESSDNSPKDKIVLIDQITKDFYELFISNGEIKIRNTSQLTLELSQNNTQVNIEEEKLVLLNNIATVSNETLVVGEGSIK